ncbi:MAG: transposase [Kiritimatiellaceae bacterium]|nr:transposase [Kiritimatiellaceae bacterium]
MPRKPRIEYDGATYHVMCRGNRQQTVFRDARDNEIFLDTLGAACVRCGWRVHAFVLMGNHYHLLVETPEANLVTGMQWLQGTYTKRFNVRHKEWGHLFQGRYKALPVDGRGDYFSTVAAYIHLNPARIKGFDFEKAKLEEHVWSSYPGYLQTGKRPEWLCVERVFGGLGLKDTPNGRRSYRETVERRILEMRNSAKPWQTDENWSHIRRGWCFGDDMFRKEIVDHLGGMLKVTRRESFSGTDVRRHDEAEAERLISLGMRVLRLTEKNLTEQKKGSPEKYALAWLVRRRTGVRNDWIKNRLQMGAATNFSAYLRRIELAKKGGWGYEEFCAIKNINL